MLMAPVLVPPERENTTAAPPLVRLFPDGSLACRRNVTIAPDATVSADTVTREVAGEAAPGVTVIVGNVDVTETAPIVAPIVDGVPAVTAVNVAVYVPLPLSVVDPIVPALVPPEIVNATVAPPVVSALPAASRACKVSVAVPAALTLGLQTETSEVAAEITPGVTVTAGRVVAPGRPSIVARIVLATPAR